MKLTKKLLALLLVAAFALALGVPAMAAQTPDAAVPVYAEVLSESTCEPMHWIPTALMYIIGVPLALLTAPLYWIFIYFGGLSNGENFFTHFFVAMWQSVVMPISWIGNVRNFMTGC